MKVAVNRCYGGFGLSSKAKTRLAEIEDKQVYFYRQTKHSYDGGVNEYMRVALGSEDCERLFVFAITVDLGEVTHELPNDSALWFHDGRKRNDPELIQVIEELGKDANGQCANIEIVEIPDDVLFEIEEYDGMEHVAEAHRCW